MSNKSAALSVLHHRQLKMFHWTKVAKATSCRSKCLAGLFADEWETTQKNKIRVPGEGFCLLTPLVKRHLARASQRANTALAGHSRTKGRTLFEGRRARRAPPLSDANKHFDQILSKSVNSSNATLTFQCSGEVAGSVMLEYQVATNCSCCIQVPYVDITSSFFSLVLHIHVCRFHTK